jgi:hypothetical protein
VHKCGKFTVGGREMCAEHDSGFECGGEASCHNYVATQREACPAHGGGQLCMQRDCPHPAQGDLRLCREHDEDRICLWGDCRVAPVLSKHFCAEHEECGIKKAKADGELARQDGWAVGVAPVLVPAMPAVVPVGQFPIPISAPQPLRHASHEEDNANPGLLLRFIQSCQDKVITKSEEVPLEYQNTNSLTHSASWIQPSRAARPFAHHFRSYTENGSTLTDLVPCDIER